MEASLPPPQCLAAMPLHTVPAPDEGHASLPLKSFIAASMPSSPALGIGHTPPSGEDKAHPPGEEEGHPPGEEEVYPPPSAPTHWCLGHDAMATAASVVGPRGGMMVLLSSMAAPLAPEGAHPPPPTAPSGFSIQKKLNPFPIGKLFILIWGCLFQMIKMKFVNPKFFYCLQFVPACDDALKSVVGMKFDCIQAVEKFYRAYVHEVSFSVRIGAQGKVVDVVENKRFLCSRQGFSKNHLTGTVAPTLKKPKKCEETKCGCNAHTYVKLGSDKKYYIASMVEEHNHGLVSPWPVERQGSIMYRHNMFKIFQEEVIAARDQCFVVGIAQQDGIKIVKINDASMRDRVVDWCTTNMFESCSCKLFERIGIPC
jgi:hypothetical protein